MSGWRWLPWARYQYTHVLYTQVGHLRKPEIETCKMEEYRERAEAGYSHGTLRCGPLQHISVVGQVSEESGGYFPQFLGKLLGVGSWSLS